MPSRGGAANGGLIDAGRFLHPRPARRHRPRARYRARRMFRRLAASRVFRRDDRSLGPARGRACHRARVPPRHRRIGKRLRGRPAEVLSRAARYPSCRHRARPSRPWGARHRSRRARLLSRPAAQSARPALRRHPRRVAHRSRDRLGGRRGRPGGVLLALAPVAGRHRQCRPRGGGGTPARAYTPRVRVPRRGDHRGRHQDRRGSADRRAARDPGRDGAPVLVQSRADGGGSGRGRGCRGRRRAVRFGGFRYAIRSLHRGGRAGAVRGHPHAPTGPGSRGGAGCAEVPSIRPTDARPSFIASFDAAPH